MSTRTLPKVLLATELISCPNDDRLRVVAMAGLEPLSEVG